MAKHPEPGRVKTRLAGALGEEVACRLYRAFLHDLAGRLDRLPYPVTWTYWPPESPFPALLPEADCRPQHGRDLGERMATAVADQFRAGAPAVLVIGVDAPHLPAAFLAEAAAALARDADVVLGPAADGGYYLIGLAGPAPDLFRAMPWGTADVLAQTEAAARRLGLRLHLLPPSFDVDEPADLERLRALLARGEALLPETARILARSGPLDSNSRLADSSPFATRSPTLADRGGTAMDEWIEEDLALQAEASEDKASRVLDQRMIREPIRLLQPRAPLALPPTATVSDAVRMMREHRIGCVLVVERDRLVGILTERDLLLKLEHADLGRQVAEVMTPDPEVLSPDDPIVYALNRMSVGGFRHVPLVGAEGQPVGVISVKDIVDYIVDFFPNEVLTVPPDPTRGDRWRGRDGG